jgi:Mg2+/Co2+ transporter CorB
MDWLGFTIVILCLLVSGFFAASETALTGASRASMLRLSKQGNRDADVVSQLLDMRERLIGALLLGNNIANISASALATSIFTAWFGDVGVLYATGLMTALVVIFAEVLPKTIAINAPDRMALAVARPMRLTMYVLGPLLRIVEVIVRLLMRLFGLAGEHQAILSPTERLRGAVDLLHHEGKFEKHDRDMLGGLLDLRELQVSDVMIHRTEMTMINADLPRSRKTSSACSTPRICCARFARPTARPRASTSPPSRCRRGSCPRCGPSPSNSRRSAAARPISPWSSTSTAKLKVS